MKAMSEVVNKTKAARQASYGLAKLSTELKNAALNAIAEAIWTNRESLLEANQKDIDAADGMLKKGDITGAMIKRLALDTGKVQGIVDMVRSVAALDDPVGGTEYARELDEGLDLFRVTSPLGVVAVIFESRPDALVQIACLCLKSGNSVLLKGGSEARHSNRELYNIIKEATGDLPEGWIQIMEARDEVTKLLDLDAYVDLIIPRGSKEFVRYIQNNTRIPVLGHADGVCHIYVDSEADLEMAVEVCLDAKVQYPSVCNAVDAILIHENIAKSFIEPMVERLLSKGVEVRGGERVLEILDAGVKEATDDDWGYEYLDYIVVLKVVSDSDEAIAHINRYGSHHTDAVITGNAETAAYFIESVDSANVFWNASTRFADGYRYGLGSEVGISTGKIHARGPTGLEGLTIYRYILRGSGQIVADYIGEGAKKFTHRLIDEEW
jgi:glutamate-5-semialdehyde dehydrogenase